MQKSVIFILFLLNSFTICFSSAIIHGKVTDIITGEELTGATVYIKELKTGSVSGLNGSYVLKNIPRGKYILSCSFIGYSTIEKTITIDSDENKTVDFGMSTLTNVLNQVTITAEAEKISDISARSSEKLSNQILSVVSARTIELSPDLTVANVIQRVSGAIVERNSTGDGQYALLRGMDKRFNYTMVNGVKIPSPDNKNRFVPLDIFPSELLDRLEVTKSLTADMEGDGIGGAVNMVMKDAPSKLFLTANLSVGYNSLFLSNGYQYFDASGISLRSPNERYGIAYPVQMKDFTSKNLHLSTGKASPNLAGAFSYGNRLLNNKLGVMLAGSYQRSYRGNSSDLYGTSTDPEGNQIITHRFFSNEQSRAGLHAKLDMKLSDNSNIMWYNAFMDFQNAQVRNASSYNSNTTRLRWNRQQILSSTIKGAHHLSDTRFNVDWSLSYGKALNETPDNIQINEIVVNGSTTVDQNDGASRRWEHNSDRDLSGILNLNYNLHFLKGGRLDISAGGVYRDKARGSFFNEYHFKPFDDSKSNPRELVRGVDYNNFDEIKFSANSYGNLSDPLNYNASEKIAAFYLMEKLTIGKDEFIAGVRAEHTNQGYNLKFVTEGAANEGNQKYIDILPSLGLKYSINRSSNLHLTYAKAINRPSFFEIVPYSMIYEDYKERGNPDLKHTRADNLDLRYEYFPSPSEQLMMGLFYKRITNPIEFGMMNGFGQDVYYMPMNFGNANNYGLEIDLIKYFSWFGIKANYTYTSSNLTTTKIKILTNPDPQAETNIITEYVDQTRPLFGQAENVINFSLLVKDIHSGWDGQLSYSYTGSRIIIVSRYLNNDTWQAGYATLDASVDKKFKKGITLFIKASNILNSPLIQYIKKNEQNEMLTNVATYKGGIVDRKEYFGMNLLVGLRYKF